MIRRVDVEGLQTLSVLGAGYTGLVTAACLARMGHTVHCVDRDEDRIAELNRGVLPFREPGLDEAVASGLASGRLTFSSDPVALHGTAGVLVAVGTLDSAGEWTANQVEAAVAAIVADPDAPRTIVIRSTVLPGTTARLDAQARLIDPRVTVIDARQVVDVAAATAAGVRVVVHGREAVARQPGVEAGAT